MSWIQKLHETYENCRSQIGVMDDEREIPLLPICHTTQKAQIEIVLDGMGNYLRASVVPKNNARTIIPCTESSGGRTSGESAHPLCDKLQYVAADYRDHGGNRKSYFDSYEKQLASWCGSRHGHQKISAVLSYVRKRRVISDLVAAGILRTEKDGKLLRQWQDKDTKLPEIFSLLPGRLNKKNEIENWQADAFVRWLVEIPGDPQTAVWSDRVLWQCWANYYSAGKVKKDVCHVTGGMSLIADQHPAKIRNDGDKAKLLSSNDLANFTFRGRFGSADQACSVGYEVTQKAHNALRWLIGRQGYRSGDQAIVAWATSGAKIPDPMADTLGLFGDATERQEIVSVVSTAQQLAIQLAKLAAGYAAGLGSTKEIVVMGMDSATPGRMAVTFYRELTGSDFLRRVLDWHASCAWKQDFGKDKDTKQPIRFVGAPAPRDIAWAAHGRRMDDKLKKSTVERILPCIIDGVRLPRDLVESAVRHTSNKFGFQDWEWEKALGITCSLYRCYHSERRYEMALEKDRRTRDYLFGRLLAAADLLEALALLLAKERRDTGAARFMQRFADHPSSTWKTIELSLSPYKARLGARAGKYLKVIDEVMCAFDTDDFTNDKPLSGEFLIGYHCQRSDLWPTGKDAVESSDEEVDQKESE
jgi:CRISPR-associated protein Csd1